jgi:hypothetical protein
MTDYGTLTDYTAGDAGQTQAADAAVAGEVIIANAMQREGAAGIPSAREFVDSLLSSGQFERLILMAGLM